MPSATCSPTAAPAATVSAAGGILGTEAYHAGAVRAILLAKSLTETTPYGPIDVVVRLISDLRDSVDGADDKDQGIVGPEGMANIVPADDDALVYARDVASVLAIVYLGGEDMGGFFPEGVTGFYGPVRPFSRFFSGRCPSCVCVCVCV